MNGLMRALFGGISWQGWLILVMCILLLASVAVVRHSDREAGALKERMRIDQANDAAGTKADQAERDVLNCRPGKWNREAGRCDR